MTNGSIIASSEVAKDSMTTPEPAEQADPVISSPAPGQVIDAKQSSTPERLDLNMPDSQPNLVQRSTDGTQLPLTTDNPSPVQGTSDSLPDLWEVALTKMDEKDQTRLAKYIKGN
jgi:hypothetical protein